MSHDDENERKRKDRPAEQQPTPGQPTGAMRPGDQAPPGTPGTGEQLCPTCSGEGTIEGRTCATCAGTGFVIAGVGGA